jgi:nicotinate phosphoribosyltransferase
MISLSVDSPNGLPSPNVQDFVTDPERARRWTGLRQDSGDPFLFAPRAIEVYKSIGINPQGKRLIYSDSLSVDKALQLKEQTRELGLENGRRRSCSVMTPCP